MIDGNGLKGRPLRALAGLGLVLGLWIAVRVPAMQHELQALALLAAPAARLVLAQRPQAEPPPLPRVAAGRMWPAPLLPATMPPLLLRAQTSPFPGPIPSVPAAAPIATTPANPLPVPAMLRATPPDPAFALAAHAYDRQRTGQRRQAAALFDAALAQQPGNRQWQADRKALGQRWQLGGFALLRDGGSSGPAASPVLGGGQLGGSIAWLTDPFARRPLALVARANVAADAGGVRGDTAQLALGLRQTLLPGVSLSVERLVPLGDATSGAFTARLAAGGKWQRLEAYGEAGALDSGQVYAGGQARARVITFGPAVVQAATWASVQTGSPTVWRVDVGPSMSARIKGVRIEADWRQRVGGNAAPGSGPVLTVSAGF